MGDGVRDEGLESLEFGLWRLEGGTGGTGEAETESAKVGSAGFSFRVSCFHNSQFLSLFLFNYIFFKGY